MKMSQIFTGEGSTQTIGWKRVKVSGKSGQDILIHFTARMYF